MNPARALHHWWRWLNTPNELRWGEGVGWRLHDSKPNLVAASMRALRKD